MKKQNVLLDFETLKAPKCNLKYEDQVAEFLGWHLGDGCISINKRYSEYTLTGDLREECHFYENIILPVFNKIFQNKLLKPAILKKYKSNGVCGIYVFDKNFVKWLQRKYKLTVGKKINNTMPEVIKTDKQKISFLRGLFDTDGSIYFCKSNVKTKKESLCNFFHYKPKIKLATISKPLIKQIHKLLVEMEFHPRFRKPTRQRENENTMYGVVLYRKSDTQKWINEISFKNIKHLTKVQIWKKFGFCPAHTKISQRVAILNGNLNPLTFYPSCPRTLLEKIKIINN